MRLVHTAGTVVLNAVLVFAVISAIICASAWGEMAGIQTGGDKSGLGGFMMLMLFMAIRWLAVAALLWSGVLRDAFDLLPGGRWGQAGIVLGLHLALGLACFYGFTTITGGLQVDDTGPQRWTWVVGLLIPIPVLAVAGWAVNRSFLQQHPSLGVALLLALILLQVLPYRSRANDMRATAIRLKAMKEQPQ